MNKKKILFFLPLISLLTFSCTNNIVSNQSVFIKKDVNFSGNFQVKLKISNNTFNTKATSSDGIKPKTIADVKSYSAFLTTNFADPFADGANPNGNGFVTNVDVSDATTSIVFRNVPRGGPYYAVIAAFDDISSSDSKKNITRSDASIIANEKQWARSSNSVTILPSGSITFSDDSSQLKAELYLEEGMVNRLGIDITVSDGGSFSNTINTYLQ